MSSNLVAQEGLKKPSIGYVKVAPGTAAWWAATLALPPLALAVALASENLGLVVGVLGSLLGGAIIYVAPAAMHLASSGGGGGGRLADVALVVYGVAQMTVGTAVSVRHATRS